MGRAYAGQGALSSYGLVSAVKIPAFRCDFELRSIGTTTLARISKTGLAADEHQPLLQIVLAIVAWVTFE
jgi:hypothetical protein